MVTLSAKSYQLVDLDIFGYKVEVKSSLFTVTTVLPAKSDSYVMFCLQIYHGLRMDRSLVY